MATSKDASQVYMRFVNLATAIRTLPTFPALDAMEERVLNGLAAVWATGVDVKVLEAMNFGADTSPSTVHRRLKGLQKKGLIRMYSSSEDSRIRLIAPTDLTLQYFEQMGRCLSLAVRDSAR